MAIKTVTPDQSIKIRGEDYELLTAICSTWKLNRSDAISCALRAWDVLTVEQQAKLIRNEPVAADGSE